MCTAHILLKFMGLSQPLFGGRHLFKRQKHLEKATWKSHLKKNPHHSVGCRQLLLGRSIEADLPTDGQAARRSCLVAAEPVDSVTVLWQDFLVTRGYVVDVVVTGGYTIWRNGNYLAKKAAHGQKKLDSCIGCDRYNSIWNYGRFSMHQGVQKVLPTVWF